MPVSLRRPAWQCHRMACSLVLCLLVWLAGLPAGAAADSSLDCAKAYETAQVERNQGHLAAAQDQLRGCAAESCPGFIRKDCLQWLTETERSQPSVVFSVQRNGADLTDVEVRCDDQVLTRTIDGKAIAVDPGVHVFTFSGTDAPRVQQRIVIREGERNRIVKVDLDGPGRGEGASAAAVAGSIAGSPATQAAEASENKRILAYGLAGVGVLGVSGFAALGWWGYGQKRDLERQCAPYCRSEQVDQVRTKYILADACLAVGVVSLGLAGYWYWTNRPVPSKSPSGATSLALSPGVWHQGATVTVEGRF